MKLKIKKFIPVILSILLIVSIIIILLIVIKNSSYTIIIKDKTRKYYTARSVVLLGNRLVCYKGIADYKTKRIAYHNINDKKEFAVINIKDVIFIEIVPDEEEIDPAWIEFLGTYRVNVSGHVGYLYLRVRNNRPYGTIRFPEWANGVHEILRSLRINRQRKTIFFIRSVLTMKELRRVGANTYFTQKFYARYSYQGKVLKGKYINRGAKNSWEAEKM